MPRKKKVEEVVEETVESSKGTVTVFYGGTSREYSKEIHGNDYKKLAESFASKFDGEIK